MQINPNKLNEKKLKKKDWFLQRLIYFCTIWDTFNKCGPTIKQKDKKHSISFDMIKMGHFM